MKELVIRRILIAAGIAFMVVYCLGPFFFMALVSISSGPDFLDAHRGMEFSLSSYKSIITSESLHFLDYLRNSLAISLVTALATIMVSSPAAYALARTNFPGKMLLLLAILAISIFPQISLVGYLFKLMSSLGWINTYQALILPYIAWALPFAVWILTSYFSQIPSDLDKAALVDGCTRWQSLHKVIFPVAAPGLISALLLVFIFSLNEFMFALMLTTDYQARTIPVGIALFQGLHGEIPWGEIMAASTLTVLPVVGLTIIFQRRIIRGLTRGAVKE